MGNAGAGLLGSARRTWGRRVERVAFAWSAPLLWSTIGVCALGIALAAPEWVPRAWSREDGPIEMAGFACFAVGAFLAAAAAARLRPDRRAVVAALALAAVLFVAAGEEISWGQRILAIETPEVLVDGNRQEELNLHNLVGFQDKAILAQLGVAGAGVLLPFVVRRRWARIGFPCFAAYLAYRMARGVAATAGWRVAGRNTEVAEVILAAGLLALAGELLVETRERPPASDSV